jgi:DNA repair protein RecO
MKILALCLRAEDRGEADKLLTLAGADGGRHFAVAKSAKKGSSKLKAAAQPFAFGEYIIEKSRNINIVAGADIAENFYECWGNLAKYTSASIVLELADNLSRMDNLSAQDLMGAVKALKAISITDTYPLIFTLGFISQMLKSLGADLSTYGEIPLSAKQLLISEIPDTAEKATVYLALKYAALILKQDFGIGLNAVKEMYKLEK